MASINLIKLRIEAFIGQLCEELGEVDGREGVCWLDAVENRAVAIGDAVATTLVRKQSADRAREQDESLCPECGRQGRYRGDRPRELVTRRGPVTITEPEYSCPCCRKAFFPDDRGARH